MSDIIAQNKFFSAHRVAEGVTRIVGVARECCYLLEGVERALLIDGLTGIGSLRAFVRELTELPVTVAVTHGHMDHTGIAWESDTVYLHPDDLFLLYGDFGEHAKKCLDFADVFLKLGVPCRTKPTERDVLDAHPVRTLPIHDGDTIDLGGLLIEVISVPGHTRGSVVFLDRAHRTVFAGDACNSNTLLNLEGSASISEYKAGLEHLRSFFPEFDVLWSGHDHQAVPKGIVDDGIALCERILARTDDKLEIEDAFGGKSLLAVRRTGDFRTEDGSLCNIVYHPETIFTGTKPRL